MKIAFIVCGLFLFLNANASTLVKNQERTETTFTCQELEGAANWSVVIYEDKALNKFWGQLKYELVEYECDDVSNGSQVGMKCNQTGGAMSVASPKIAFDTCEMTNGKSVFCKNKDFTQSSIQIKSNNLKFKLDMSGENGEQLTEFFTSVTGRSVGQFRVVGVAECTVQTLNVVR